MRKRALTLTLFCAALALSACSKNKDKQSSTESAPYQSELSLESVASDSCLNVGKLYEGLRSISPNQPVVVVPTSIGFEGNVRENFRRLVSFGQLEVGNQSFSKIQGLPTVTQEGCTSFTVAGSDSSQKVFQIQPTARESVRGVAEDGEELEYTWVSPRSLIMKRRYIAYDVPCGSSDKPVFVTITRTLDWSTGELPASLPATGSSMSISADFLGWAAQTVGGDPESLYTAGAGGDRTLDVSRLREMMQRPPLPAVVSCTGVAEPAPAPSPDPGTDPATPPSDPTTPDPNTDPSGPSHEGGGEGGNP